MSLFDYIVVGLAGTILMVAGIRKLRSRKRGGSSVP
jgi:uncharacterized membrane protein YuzA (DUF378 family)